MEFPTYRSPIKRSTSVTKIADAHGVEGRGSLCTLCCSKVLLSRSGGSRLDHKSGCVCSSCWGGTAGGARSLLQRPEASDAGLLQGKWAWLCTAPPWWRQTTIHRLLACTPNRELPAAAVRVHVLGMLLFHTPNDEPADSAWRIAVLHHPVQTFATLEAYSRILWSKECVIPYWTWIILLQ